MPMIFVFNFVGLAMVALGAGLFLTFNGLLRADASGFIAGCALVLMDISWRGWKFLASPREQVDTDSDALRFVSPREGGNIMLLPVWILGVLMVFFFGRTLFALALR